MASCGGCFILCPSIPEVRANEMGHSQAIAVFSGCATAVGQTVQILQLHLKIYHAAF